MKKKDDPTLFLLAAMLFGIAGILGIWLSIRDGSGPKMAAAIVFLIAAWKNFHRWQSADRE